AFFRQIGLASYEWQVGKPQRAQEMLGELGKEEFKDLRGWEFDYLNRVVHSELRSVQLDYYFDMLNERNVLTHQTGMVRGAALSPDGKYGVVSNYAQHAFDLTTGKKAGVLPGRHYWAPAFSSDGKRLVSGGEVSPGIDPQPLPGLGASTVGLMGSALGQGSL